MDGTVDRCFGRKTLEADEQHHLQQEQQEQREENALRQPAARHLLAAWHGGGAVRRGVRYFEWMINLNNSE